MPAQKCPRCKVNIEFCFCSAIKTLKLNTAVDVIMHFKELNLTSNSANLIHLSIPESKIHVRGQKGNPLDVGTIFRQGFTPIYLYPLETSIPLTEETLVAIERPIQLIIPDGSWRQARKIIDREKCLQNVPCYSLRNMPASEYQLRREHLKDGLSTFEACFHALSIIEGKEKMAPVWENFEIMVEQNLKERGRISWKDGHAGPKQKQG